jgi:hypothetical protein
MIKMKPVESSVIKRVGYDSQEQVLRIEFRSGDVYDYEKVPWWVVGQLLSSESLGRFYNHSIRDVYPFRKNRLEEAA